MLAQWLKPLRQKMGLAAKFVSKRENTVADGLYHLGFAIEGNRLMNEDGDKNASLSSVSEWLNGLLATDLANGSLLVGVSDAGLPVLV